MLILWMILIAMLLMLVKYRREQNKILQNEEYYRIKKRNWRIQMLTLEQRKEYQKIDNVRELRREYQRIENIKIKNRILQDREENIKEQSVLENTEENIRE